MLNNIEQIPIINNQFLSMKNHSHYLDSPALFKGFLVVNGKKAGGNDTKGPETRGSYAIVLPLEVCVC